MWLLRFMGGLSNVGLFLLVLGIWWLYNPEWAFQPTTFIKAGGILLAVSILAGIALLLNCPKERRKNNDRGEAAAGSDVYQE